jgi:hypothetical protein
VAFCGNSKVIWTKTDAGRSEIQARRLVNDRAQRNLLLLIDGNKPDDGLLQNVKGVSAADFDSLQALGLIEPVAAGVKALAPTAVAGAAQPASPTTSSPTPRAPLGYAEFTAALTQIISSELGLRGFPLTLAVDKASTTEELTQVATKVINQIRERKGLPAAAKASQTLYGL